MAVIVHDEGEVHLLKYALGVVTAPSYTVRLYSNNLTPTNNSVLADFTQVTGSGYSAVNLIGTDWTVSEVSDVATATHAALVFTFSGASTAYGWYLTDTGSTKVIFSERFSGAPFVLPSSGGEITITPTLTLDECL